MPPRGWSGLHIRGLSRRQETVACVLSGGGSRASFQLGALSWLYEHDPLFTPTVFVGTSAGAILAAALAQGAGPQEQLARNQQLLDIWYDLKTQDDMFTPRPWLGRAQAEMPGWLELVEQAGTPSPPSPGRSFASRFPFLRRPESPSSPPSPTPPPPPPDPLEAALTPDEDLRPEWSLGDVVQLMGHIGKLPRLGSDLAAIRQGMEHTRSMYRPGPMLARLLDGVVFDQESVQRTGNTLRMAMVALESGELRFMREDGRLTDRDGHVFDDTSHPLATGVLASCAIPAVFRPVRLGTETYIDGGARDNLAAELTIGQLHPGRTYVITSQAAGVRTRQSMADADLISVVMRALEILVDEAGRDEIAYAHSAGAIVIAPDLDVHSSMTVHPGLIRIHVAYGWMRAAEAILQAGPEQEARTRRIIALRMKAVQLEERISKGDESAHTAERLVGAKRELRDVVTASDPRVLPPGAGEWWAQFERHAEPPTFELSWLDD